MPHAPWASMRRARPRSSPDARRFVLAALVAVAASTSFADFSGRVVAVADGDTITVRDGERDVQVRLWGIDAPERGQPWWKRSREALAALASRRDAQLLERGRDSYGRTLARVVVDGVDLGEAQLRGGWAWVFLRYTNDAAFVALESEARAARRGLWASPDPEPPWRYRERMRTSGRGARAMSPAPIAPVERGRRSEAGSLRFAATRDVDRRVAAFSPPAVVALPRRRTSPPGRRSAHARSTAASAHRPGAT